jgi:hypothetical protein
MLFINPAVKGGMSNFTSLKGVAYLFSNKSAVLAGWVHYVVFDLWTGQFVMYDGLSRGIPQILLSLNLFLVMMLGPMGFLVYFAAREFLPRRWGGGVKLF